MAARYDSIGADYARYRREDPDLRRRIADALGPARTVVNVGAGAGSYEPTDRTVIAVEPSAVMAAQRPPERPAIRGVAEDLPLHDDCVDAAMAVLTVHHWPDPEAGIRELRRVARDRVVLVTIDARVSGTMWLIADYFPWIGRLDDQIFPHPEVLAGWLGGADVQIVPISRHTPDWTLLSYWAHPERALDPDVRKTTSGFARMPADDLDRGLARLRADLDSGEWDRRYGRLRSVDATDAGLRLMVSPAR